jgi:heptosyltransferase II
MKVLIELPTWLGDTIMSTPAIENLVNHSSNIEITLVGSLISIETLRDHPKVNQVYIWDKSIFSFFNISKKLGEFDIFFSFRNSYRSKLIKALIRSKSKYQFNKNKYIELHQVEKYNQFINDSLNIISIPGKLKLHVDKRKKIKKIKLLGINPGASYGSAKRWYPEEFGFVAANLSNDYDIIIFGGVGEKEIAKDIENYLTSKSITNFQNLAGKTSIKELINCISNLDLFITGDSGPMHLAAAFQVPTVSIFGPTRDNETSQWKNEKSKVVKKNLDCQPCMKRKCPLKHHNCMKQIDALEVLESVAKLRI